MAPHIIPGWSFHHLARCIFSVFFALALACSLGTPLPAAAQPDPGCDVYTWGSNSYGQFADGRELVRNVPAPVPGLSGIIDISLSNPWAIGEHYLAVKKDGTVYAWGENDGGQLGDGTENNHTDPRLVPGIRDVAAVEAVSRSSLALKKDGTVWVWGHRAGAGGWSSEHAPVQVPGVSQITAISSSGNHSLAVKADGTVWGWGVNYDGELGDGLKDAKWATVQVPSIQSVKAVAAGEAFSLALKLDGTVWGWGSNARGQLGDGTTAGRYTPMPVTGLDQVTSIFTYGSTSFAIRTDGTTWAWGDGEFFSSLLAPGTPEADFYPSPVQLTGLPNTTAIAFGYYHRMSLRQDGTVWGWGTNTEGQLGDGTYTSRDTPVQVTGLDHVKKVSVGLASNMALKSDGTVWAWGLNSAGVFGQGDTTMRWTPTKAANIDGVIALSSSYAYTLALKNDGSVWAWGYVDSSSLVGDAAYPPLSLPVRVPQLEGVTAVAASGTSYALALKADGSVWIWGKYFRYDPGGGGEHITQFPPAQVPGLSNIQAIASGSGHDHALKDDGTVWSWGENSYGELGDGTLTSSSIPVQVQGLSNVVAIATGFSTGHTLALKDDGTVWAWGNNSSGQLGDGTTTKSSVPVQVKNLSHVKAITTGMSFSLALKDDGTVWGWGINQSGELGSLIYPRTNPLPVQVIGLRGITAIAAGWGHGLAQKGDEVWAWGVNSYAPFWQYPDYQDNIIPAPVLHNSCPGGIVAGGWFSSALVQKGYSPRFDLWLSSIRR